MSVGVTPEPTASETHVSNGIREFLGNEAIVPGMLIRTQYFQYLVLSGPVQDPNYTGDLRVVLTLCYSRSENKTTVTYVTTWRLRTYGMLLA